MIVQEFTIVDYIQRRANTFTFESGVNLFLSKNNTIGKSSLMKSLFYNLGFNIKIFPQNWDVNSMIFKVKIVQKGEKYTITRNKDLFYINESSNALSEKDYALWLQDVLGSKILLKEKTSKKLSRVYASEVLLPFYIDQDKSWNGYLYKNTSDSFGRYSNIPKGVFEYYLSISNDRILELETDKNTLESEIKHLNLQLNALTLLNSEYNLTKNPKALAVDLDELKVEIQLYLSKLNLISNLIAKYNTEILSNQLNLNIEKNDVIELKKLAVYHNNRFKEIKNICIYCNSQLTLKQSLTRLEIRNNIFDIQRLIDEKNIKILNLESKISNLESLKQLESQAYNEVKTTYEEIRKYITFNEYIDQEANRKISNKYLYLESDIHTNLSKKNLCKKQKADEIRTLKKQIDSLKNTIAHRFKELINKISISITDLDIKDINVLDFKEIKSSGNDNNKKMLALYIIYSSIVDEFSKIKIPIGMDSFIKNETTTNSKQEMFKLVSEHFFKLNNQIFFSIVKENLKYLDNIENYHIISLDKPILKEIEPSNNIIQKEFGFISIK
ncbi:hypothetical protein ASG65_17730 [Bacillus sp. Leaf13]|nr:hypothetical protein ASG65_17730 [Bacillus sp. Leaf13]